MKHLQTITRMPNPAQTGGLSLIENFVIIVFSVVFQGWDNLGAAISGLQKFYGKTPD